MSLPRRLKAKWHRHENVVLENISQQINNSSSNYFTKKQTNISPQISNINTIRSKIINLHHE